VKTGLVHALIVLACGLFWAVNESNAQQAGKMPKVGVLHGGNSSEAATIQREPFERGLREHGWLPGSTLSIDYRYAEGDAAKLEPLANELVRSGVDVIVARGNVAVDAARGATRTIPIVMSAWAGDPVTSGLAKSLSRPGGNITGIRGFTELDSKRLELLKEAFPAIRRVGVVANPEFGRNQYAQQMDVLKAGADSLGLELQRFEIRRADEIPRVFALIGQAKVDALLVRGDPQLMDPKRAEIVALVAKRKLPAVYWWPFFVQAGGLMSYGESLSAFHHASAMYVSQILRGAKPGDLAIQQPAKFQLVINLKAAKALGIDIPKAILFRADELIQ
jgi:putative ABC transport system substrate-binding protein